MFTKALLLGASLATLVLSEPIPQAAATTENFAALESSALASLASLTTGLPGLPSIYSDLPSLPASIESVLETAVPTSVLTAEDPCSFVTDAPQWYNSLPANVKSALTSYESALISWSIEHSAALASLTSGFTTGTVGTAPALVCTNTGAPAAGGKTTSSGAAQNTGTATGAGAGAGSTGSVGSSSSKGAAPRATGAVAVGLSGVVGVLGLMVAL